MVARSPPPSAIPWRRPGAPRASRSSMLPPGSHARRSRRRAGSCSRSPTAPMEPSSRRRARTAAYASGPRRSRRVHPRESSGSRRASSSARSCLAASSGRSGAPLVRELRAARWQGSRGQLGVRAAASTASGRARGPWPTRSRGERVSWVAMRIGRGRVAMLPRSPPGLLSQTYSPSGVRLRFEGALVRAGLRARSRPAR
jgi:hypothetical protein